jgi:hypothetical protein
MDGINDELRFFPQNKMVLQRQALHADLCCAENRALALREK